MNDVIKYNVSNHELTFLKKCAKIINRPWQSLAARPEGETTSFLLAKHSERETPEYACDCLELKAAALHCPDCNGTAKYIGSDEISEEHTQCGNCRGWINNAADQL